MKKLITICVGLIVAGCATISQLEEIEKRLARIEGDTTIQDHEKRLVRIEGDLYRVEVKSAPKVEKPEVKKPAEPKFVPAKEVEKNVADAKVDAFLKEYFGVQFGDSIDKFPGKVLGGEKDRSGVNISRKEIPVLKKFKYFNKAHGDFCDGWLCEVIFCAEIDAKYSVDSTNEKMNQAFADLAVTLGLDGNAFGLRTRNISSYRFFRLNNPWGFGRDDGIRRYAACIVNDALQDRLKEERRQADAEARRKANATGETLPDPE